MSSTFGTVFKVTTFGESHGKGVGAVVDGCPPGLSLSERDIQPQLDRRRPGQSAVTTARQESDLPEIVAGVFEGKTTGMPITVLVRNENQRSGDYDQLRDKPRPGHADYAGMLKYGFDDARPVLERASARETTARVAAGAVARALLKEAGIEVRSHVLRISDAALKHLRRRVP